MKKPIHKIATYTALILVSALPFSDVFAETDKKSTAPAVSAVPIKNPIDSRRKALAEKSRKVITEARDALSGTEDALMALDKNDSKSALATLQDVSKKLDTLLSQNPASAMITADLEADIIDFAGDSKTLEQTVKKADELLDDGKLQDARAILAELASEMRITTVNIPLGTYPAAIKQAISLVEAGKTNEAAQSLDAVLNTLVEVTEVMPLPVLRAEVLLSDAAELEHKTDLSKETSRVEVLKYVDAAKDNLKVAEILGYGSKDDYEPIYTIIADIKDVIHTEKSAAIWAKVKQEVLNLKNKIMQSKK